MSKKIYKINEQTVEIEILNKNAQEVHFRLHAKEYKFQLHSIRGCETNIAFIAKGRPTQQKVVVGHKLAGERHMLLSSHEIILREEKSVPHVKGAVGGEHFGKTAAELKAPMPGKIFKLLKKVGEEVQKGETVCILEAMKMEHAIKAPLSGTLVQWNFQEGSLVKGGNILGEISDRSKG